MIHYANESYGVTDIFCRTSLDLCFSSNEQIGYVNEKMKLMEMRNKHFHNIWPTEIGLKLGLSNATFNNVIHIDFNIFKMFENPTDFAKHLADEQNLIFMPGDLIRGGNLLRYDSCVNVAVFTEIINRLNEFAKKHLVDEKKNDVEEKKNDVEEKKND